VLRQICNRIPQHPVPKLVRGSGTEAFCCSFSAWSDCVALIFAQLTQVLRLNDPRNGDGIHHG
jgi:hypothetical protein